MLGNSGGAHLGRQASERSDGRCMAEKAEAWLKEAGATTRSVDGTSSTFPAAASTRRALPHGRRPEDSVVDKYCRVHDVDNLYVIDGSVHVTNGGFNPVLTIMAIAYRASENLVKTWKGTHGRA